jgi:hypothetical protein
LLAKIDVLLGETDEDHEAPAQRPMAPGVR